MAIHSPLHGLDILDCLVRGMTDHIGFFETPDTGNDAFYLFLLYYSDKQRPLTFITEHFAISAKLL